MPEPNVLVDNCRECPCHSITPLHLIGYCNVDTKKRSTTEKTGRRFPRWCPLLKGPITVAAVRKRIG